MILSIRRRLASIDSGSTRDRCARRSTMIVETGSYDWDVWVSEVFRWENEKRGLCDTNHAHQTRKCVDPAYGNPGNSLPRAAPRRAAPSCTCLTRSYRHERSCDFLLFSSHLLFHFPVCHTLFVRRDSFNFHTFISLFSSSSIFFGCLCLCFWLVHCMSSLHGFPQSASSFWINWCLIAKRDLAYKY